MKGGWLLALLALHLLTAAPMPWENVPRPAAWLQGCGDFAFLLCVALLCARATASPRAVAFGAAALSLFVPLYRFGETLMPAFYGKPFEPWVDLLELPGLVHLLMHQHSTGVQVLMVAAIVVALPLVFWVTLGLWRVLLRGAAYPSGLGIALLVTQGLFAAAWLVDEASGQRIRLLRPSMLRAAHDDLGATINTRRWHGDAVVNERVRIATDELAQLPQDLRGLAGADVYLLIVESYGRGVVGNRARAAYESWLKEDEDKLTAASWHAASGWIAPSVRGGGSTLAHAELLSGIDVEDRRVFDHLLASHVRTLAAIARDAGYRTVDVQPGMPRAWPEAKVLGFTDDVFFSAFDYHGRAYHWGVMPDQFALQHVLQTVVQPADRPLFVQFVGVTSHAPFSMVPPYYDDWERVAAADAYTGAPAQQWDIGWTTYAGHPQTHAAYLATIRYCLRVMFGFTRKLSRRSLVVVVGDHQPPLEFQDQAQRGFDVPIHFISNDAALLTPWVGRGLQAGLVPPANAASFDASRFLFRFLRAYGAKR